MKLCSYCLIDVIDQLLIVVAIITCDDYVYGDKKVINFADEFQQHQE